MQKKILVDFECTINCLSFKTFPSAEFKSNRKLAKMSFAQMRGENGPKTRRVTLSLSLHPPAVFSSLPERQCVRSKLRSYSFFGSQNRYHNFNSGFLETLVFETVYTLQDELQDSDVVQLFLKHVCTG